MAVALDVAGTEVGVNSATSPSAYVGLTTAGSLANGAIVAMITVSTLAPGITGVTWGSQAMSLISGTTVTSGGAHGHIEIWGLIGVTQFGNQTLTVTWTGGTMDRIVQACSWTGVNQTGGATSFPNGNTASATSTAPAVTITSAIGDAVMACFADQTVSFTSTSGTNLYTDNSLTNMNGAGLRAAGASSVSCTTNTITSEAWIASGCDIAAFVAATGFGIGTNHPPRGFLPMQKFNQGLRPTQAFPGPDHLLPQQMILM